MDWTSPTTCPHACRRPIEPTLHDSIATTPLVYSPPPSAVEGISPETREAAVFTKEHGGGKGPWIFIAVSLTVMALAAACSSTTKSASSEKATTVPATAPTTTTPAPTTAAPAPTTAARPRSNLHRCLFRLRLRLRPRRRLRLLLFAPTPPPTAAPATSPATGPGGCYPTNRPTSVTRQASSVPLATTLGAESMEMGSRLLVGQVAPCGSGWRLSGPSLFLRSGPGSTFRAMPTPCGERGSYRTAGDGL